MGEPPRPLKDLEPSALAEALVALARRARRQFDNGGTIELAETLAEVREAADEVSGPSLHLLEVAEAFLRTLARSDLGKTELALRRFALGDGDARVAMLEQLAAGRAVKLDETGELRSELQGLAEVGALRKRPDASHDLRPALRSVALDLVEPEPFRVWRLVNKARSSAGLARLPAEKAELCIAAELGVTVHEAHQHLGRHPLANAPGAAQTHDLTRWTSHYTRPPTALRAPTFASTASSSPSARPTIGGLMYRALDETSDWGIVSRGQGSELNPDLGTDEGVVKRQLRSELWTSGVSQPSGARRSMEMTSWSTERADS